MNKLSIKRIFLILFIISVAVSSGNSQIFKKNASRYPEKGLFVKSLSKKQASKANKPKAVLRAKKNQVANERKLKKDYEKSVNESKKRSIAIQTPEVQARMRQDKKDAAARDRAKKKKIRTSNKKVGKKHN